MQKNHMQKKIFSGQYGLVLLLDERTQRRATEISGEYEEGNAIHLGGAHAPHITLYHAKLLDVPRAFVGAVLEPLRPLLPIALSFTEVSESGGKFLFWHMKRTSKLVRAHEDALILSAYFDPRGVQQAEKEKIDLTPAQRVKVRLFGYPHVRELWRPHVTVGYFPEGCNIKTRPEAFRGSVVQAAFVRIGDFGTISEVIMTCAA